MYLLIDKVFKGVV